MNMRIGVIANLHREGAKDVLSNLAQWCAAHGHELCGSRELGDVDLDGIEIISRDEVATDSDILVSMGGDGTFLASVRAVGNSGTPLLGINLGSLGFLTQMTPDELTPALEAVARGAYKLEERMLLKVKVEGKQSPENPYALNDVVVDNGPVSRIIDIKLRVNGEEVVTYRADGLILSTPTGSTAYSLACGGPIMNPGMDAIIATPISAFSLSTRPMIFAASDILGLRIRSQHQVAGLTLDGQISAPLIDTDLVTVRRANFRARIITFPGNSFYKVLKKKLHWGISPLSR